MRSFLALLLPFLIVGLMGGCDDDPPADGDADVDGDGDGDGDVDADGDGDGDGDVDTPDGDQDDPPCMEGGVCTGPSECTEAPPFVVSCLSGTVADPEGQPVADQLAVACATNACYTAFSDSQGFFAISLPNVTVTEVGLYFPSQMARISPFCAIDDLCNGGVRTCGGFVLRDAPSSGQVIGQSPLTEDVQVTATDGDATLVFPAGADVILPIEADDWVTFARYPLDADVPCFIDPDHQPLALYAVTPSDVLVIEPGTIANPVWMPAQLDLPNDVGLGPDTDVEIWVVGGSHAVEASTTEGHWAPWSDGAVSSDGARIQTGEGQGLGYLTWFGVYPAD